MDAYELIVIGGGPAGMAAAYEAYKKGLKKVLIIERNNRLGGILNQCIHNGLSENVIKELDTCLESKELIKVKIQDGCELEPKATANDVAARLNAEFVQAIGHKFSIYRQSNTLPIEKRINLKLAK